MNPDDSRSTPLVAAPAFLGRWRNRVILAFLLLVPFLVPVPRVLEANLVIATFGDRLHIVLLGATALFLYWYGPVRGRLILSAIVAAAIGGSIELLQTQVGRHALWHDFFQDLIGIGIAVGFLLWRGKGSRPGLALFAVLVLLVPFQMRQLPLQLSVIRVSEERFPLLADFEYPDEEILWSDDTGSRIYTVATDGPHGNILRIETGPSKSWPGAVMRRFPRDWSGYDRLLIDIRIEEAYQEVVPGGIVVWDYKGLKNRNWKMWPFTVTDQWRTFEVSLDDLYIESADRDLDISDLFRLRICLSGPLGHTILEMDNLRLE